MDATQSNALIQNLSKLRDQCPNMRFGQLMATLGLISEDENGHSLWEIEDDELLAVMEQFGSDLAQRGHGIGV